MADRCESTNLTNESTARGVINGMEQKKVVLKVITCCRLRRQGKKERDMMHRRGGEDDMYTHRREQ